MLVRIAEVVGSISELNKLAKKKGFDERGTCCVNLDFPRKVSGNITVKPIQYKTTFYAALTMKNEY